MKKRILLLLIFLYVIESVGCVQLLLFIFFIICFLFISLFFFLII